MSCVKLGAIVFSLFAVTAFVRASESDEIREKAQSVQREAAELAEQGHKEEATWCLAASERRSRRSKDGRSGVSMPSQQQNG